MPVVLDAWPSKIMVWLVVARFGNASYWSFQYYSMHDFSVSIALLEYSRPSSGCAEWANCNGTGTLQLTGLPVAAKKTGTVESMATVLQLKKQNFPWNITKLVMEFIFISLKLGTKRVVHIYFSFLNPAILRIRVFGTTTASDDLWTLFYSLKLKTIHVHMRSVI